MRTEKMRTKKMKSRLKFSVHSFTNIRTRTEKMRTTLKNTVDLCNSFQLIYIKTFPEQNHLLQQHF